MLFKDEDIHPPYQSIVESLPLFVYRIDTEGRLTYVNHALKKHLQLSDQQLLGKTAYDFYPERLAQKYRTDDQEVISSRNTLHEIEENIDPNSQKTQFVEIIKTPVLGKKEQVIGIQGVFWDISQRFLKDQEQKQQGNLLTTIAEHSPDFVILLDKQLNVVYINRTIKGVDKNSIIGKYLPDLATGQKEEVEQHLSHTLSTHQMSSYKTHYRAPDGQLHFFETRVTHITSSDDIAQLHLTSRDITERLLHDQQLQEAAAVFTHASEAIVIIDYYGEITNANQAFSNLSGLSLSQVLGRQFKIILGESTSEERYEEILKIITQKGFWQGEQEITTPANKALSVRVAASAIRNDDNIIHSYVILVTDITQQKQHQHQLERIAHYDALTGLPNRYLLSIRLSQYMQAASRHNKRLAVLYIDLDGFKEINDRFGHQTGDSVLVEVSSKINKTLSKNDTIARLGGDEFVIVIPDIDDYKDMTDYFKRILGTFKKPIESNKGKQELSASLGITFFPQQFPADADHLIRQADTAMYQAKLHGKNRFEYFDVERDKLQRNSSETLSQLQTALQTDAFRLFYQPKVDMKNGSIIGVEALLRWQHPLHGLLTPDNFLGATTDNPLAIDIDNWVITNTLSQISQWRKQGINIPVSINISIQRLEFKKFPEMLTSILRFFPMVPAQSITFEILESSAVRDTSQASKSIHACRALGVQFSLDDFGTGFSTLNFLKDLPAEELKIDRSFIRDMLSGEDDLSIIRGILGLAEAFKKNVVAEGVESEAHGNALIQLNCSQAQGYAIAKPMPADAFISWTKTWRPYTSWKNANKK